MSNDPFSLLGCVDLWDYNATCEDISFGYAEEKSRSHTGHQHPKLS